MSEERCGQNGGMFDSVCSKEPGHPGPWHFDVHTTESWPTGEGYTSAVTRSAEIPEAAVEAAVEAFRDAHAEGVIVGRHEKAIRAVLSAALPYLVPAEPTKLYDWGPDWDQAGYEAAVAKGMPRLPGDHVAPAPAGDGGLREALEKLHDRLYATGHQVGKAIALELDSILEAHPVAPAVPPPVDREALDRALANIPVSYSHTLLTHNATAGRLAPHARKLIVDAVLAVLAGEQEQTKR